MFIILSGTNQANCVLNEYETLSRSIMRIWTNVRDNAMIQLSCKSKIISQYIFRYYVDELF